MIEIEEPPDIAACTTCMRPLVWLFSGRRSIWVAFATEPTDIELLRVHRCRLEGGQPMSWRYLEPQDPETIRAGAERVRQELQQLGENPS